VSSCGEFERVELTYVMSDYSEVHTQSTGAESGWNRHTWHMYTFCAQQHRLHINWWTKFRLKCIH